MTDDCRQLSKKSGDADLHWIPVVVVGYPEVSPVVAVLDLRSSSAEQEGRWSAS